VIWRYGRLSFFVRPLILRSPHFICSSSFLPKLTATVPNYFSILVLSSFLNWPSLLPTSVSFVLLFHIHSSPQQLYSCNHRYLLDRLINSMATATTPNSRASLLAGLRTGGVRSTSQPYQVPHTAALTGSFSAPRFASTSHPSNPFPEEDEDDELADIAAHSLSFNGTSFNGRQGIPMTAAADGSAHNFQQQQQQLIMRQLAAQRAAMGAGMSYPGNGDQTEMQAQMMQMEMLKYQVCMACTLDYESPDHGLRLSTKHNKHSSTRLSLSLRLNASSNNSLLMVAFEGRRWSPSPPDLLSRPLTIVPMWLLNFVPELSKLNTAQLWPLGMTLVQCR
jgi:hypothetical protein